MNFDDCYFPIPESGTKKRPKITMEDVIEDIEYYESIVKVEENIYYTKNFNDESSDNIPAIFIIKEKEVQMFFCDIQRSFSVDYLAFIIHLKYHDYPRKESMKDVETISSKI